MDSGRSSKKGKKTAPKRPKCVENSTNVLPPYIHLRDGQWYCRKYFPNGRENGKVKYHQVVRRVDPETPEQAALISEQIETLYRQAQIKRARVPTVSEIANEFVEAKRIAVESRTYDYYKWMLRYFTGPFGQLDADTIDPRAVQTFYRGFEKQGLSAGMIRKIHIFLSMVYKQAVRWEVVKRNPCEGTVPPRAHKPDIEIMSEAEARRFREVAFQMSPILAFALDSWMRPNEYCALAWRSVNLDKGLVTVARTVEFPKGGGFRFKNKAKTDAGRRTILIGQPMRELLATLPHNSELVFPSRKGTPMRQGNLTRQGNGRRGGRTLKDLCEKAKIEPKTLYSLRHTGISIAIANGADIKSVSERAGHKSVQITLDTYGHLMPKGLHRTVEILSGALY